MALKIERKEIMKNIFILLFLFSKPVLAENITCEGVRPDKVKIQIEIVNNERASIAYVDPIYGVVSRQGVEKDYLREADGQGIYYVSEALPHKRILSFPQGADTDPVQGVLLSQSLNITCSISGDLAEMLPEPPQIICKDIDYKKFLFDAIWAGRVSGVTEALQCGAKVNDLNDQGCTPLLYATDINCGANLPQKILGDKDGKWTIGAQSPGNKNQTSYALFDVMNLLVSKGALLDARDPKNGETPLIKLVRNSGDSDTISSFLENEPNVDAQDMEGNTALIWATTLSTISAESLGAIQELNLANADRNLKNSSQNTAYATAKGLGLSEKNHGFQHEYDRRILRQLMPANKTVVVIGEGGACSPLQINLKEGDAVEFRLNSKDKMYLMRSPKLSLDLMAMAGDSVRQVITMSKQGQFDFTCGIHGAPQQSMGKIVVQ